MATGTALLLSKYNAAAMEWSVLEKVRRQAAGVDETLLRFGGAARWKLGDPEGAARPGAGGEFHLWGDSLRLFGGRLAAAIADLRAIWSARATACRRTATRRCIGTSYTTTRTGGWCMRDPWHVDRPERRRELYGLSNCRSRSTRR